MCGFITFQVRSPDREMVQSASENLKHRGPDDKGVFRANQGRTVMAHRRLSIIDREGGHQPMSRGEVTAVYNGEIYNYRELRQELIEKGAEFSTDSDTEVLIQAYREWDTDCLSRFRGMFSFVIWDEASDRMFCARDRLGQKPLIYYQDDDEFIAGSEFQAILSAPQVKPVLNLSSVPLYLGLQYIPAPDSGFRSLHKLEPAHYMVVRDGCIVEKQRYWSPEPSQKTKLDYESSKSRLRELLTESTKLRLRSDVPLGAFLSGGVDSSITVALMSQLSTSPVKTYSIGFDYESYSELEYARTVAKRFETDHHEFTVSPDITDLVTKLVRHYGEPFADSSAVPTYYISRETRRDVTVALTGDGADEAFGGYNYYRAIDLASRYFSFLPQSLGTAINRWSFLPFKWRRFASILGQSASAKHWAYVQYFSQSQQRKLLNDSFSVSFEAPESYLEEWFRKFRNVESEVDRSMAVDAVTYLPNDILTKVDIASMMNSLETRSPFLDHKIQEFAASLPVGFKIGSGEKKRILKDTFSDLIPESITTRPKSGFSIPRSEWLRGELREPLESALIDCGQVFDELFDSETVQTMIERHQSGEQDYGKQLWALMCFSLWMDEFDVRLP